MTPRRARHRDHDRGWALILVWLLAGTFIVVIVVRGAPLGEPAPPQPPPLRVGPLDPCPRGWTTYTNTEADTICVRVTPGR